MTHYIFLPEAGLWTLAAPVGNGLLWGTHGVVGMPAENVGIGSIKTMTGWWFGCHQFNFPRNMKGMSSSLLTDHIFERGGPTTNQMISWLFNQHELACFCAWKSDVKPILSSQKPIFPLTLSILLFCFYIMLCLCISIKPGLINPKRLFNCGVPFNYQIITIGEVPP